MAAIGQAVTVTGPDGSITYWNAAAEDLYGWPAAEVLGRNILEVTPTSQATEDALGAVDELRAGRPWRGVMETQRRDGSTFLRSLTISPVSNDAGEVTAFIGVASDVSAEREMIADLDESHAQLAAVLDSSGDLFAITDASGRIGTVKGASMRLLGVQPNALEGVSIFDLAQPQDRARARSVWEQGLQSAEPMPAEDFWTPRADGTWMCLSLIATNCLDNPSLHGIVITAHDVTDRRHAEEARAAMAGINSALVHATDESDLFRDICNLVVQGTTYHLAWIGLTDHSAPLGVRMVALADGSMTYFDALEALSRTHAHRGPLTKALESGRIYIVQNIAQSDEDSHWKALAIEHGYQSVIAMPLPSMAHNAGVLAIYSEHPNVFTSEAVNLLTELAEDLAYGLAVLRTRAERNEYKGRFEASLEAAVRAIAAAAELRDPYTAGHQRRTADLSAVIATAMGINSDAIEGIKVAASIHDIGKLTVPAEILSKPGRLTDAEFALVKQHSQAGYDIVAGIDFPWPVPETILQHPERLDGSGYPHGLKGDQISVGARILAVADTTEAMQAHRPYRPALGIDAAINVLLSGRESLFDPEAVDACVRAIRDDGFTFSR
ncbi:MAG: HD domain-containing phosphohydrolase [Acidimicrobiales bacterium]